MSTVCEQCGRAIIKKKEGKRWITYDEITGTLHSNICSTKSPRFKEGQIILRDWGYKEYHVHRIDSIHEDVGRYGLTIGLSILAHHFYIKKIDKEAKPLDNMYRLLYL